MTKEEIDILWNKALRQSVEDGSLYTRYRFAELVAAAERNSWPAEMEAMERQVNILTDALAQAKAEEREVCAKVCESMEYEFKAGHECADALRARGETK